MFIGGIIINSVPLILSDIFIVGGCRISEMAVSSLPRAVVVAPIAIGQLPRFLSSTTLVATSMFTAFRVGSVSQILFY